jgi:GNAT superfamily N-acetyltransferase
MTDPQELHPKPLLRQDVDIRRVQIPCPELNRFFYTAVGGDWYWLDRLPWTYAQWRVWVEHPTVETWMAAVAGTPAGYFELEAQPAGNVELVYFGLLPQFIGHGLGGGLLTAAIERAWQMDARRLWVHTCTLDHPSALANYCARGLRIFREETQAQEIPEQSPGPWPEARPQGSGR